MKRNGLLKKLMALVLSAAMVILAGCSSKPQEAAKPANSAAPKAAEAAQPQNVKLRWSMWIGSSAELEQWKELAADATKKYPNISIDIETTDFIGYWPKLETQFAAKNTADIVAMQGIRAQSYLNKGGLMTLTKFINDDKNVNISDCNQMMIKAFSYNNEVYAFPYDSGPYVTFYNIDLFDKYKVPYPDDNMSWDSYLDRMQKLTKDGNYGVATNTTIDHVIPYIWSAGGDYYDAKTNKYTIYSPENVKGLQFLGDLYTKYKVAKPITDPGNNNTHREQFYSGTVGMILDGPWFLTNAKNNCKFKYGIAPIPKGPAGRVVQVAGSGFGVGASTKFPKESYQIVSSITGTEALTKIAKWGRGYPARNSAVPGFTETWKTIPGIDSVQQTANKDGKPFIGPQTYQQVTEIFRANIEPVYLGSETADAALKKIQTLVDAIK